MAIRAVSCKALFYGIICNFVFRIRSLVFNMLLPIAPHTALASVQHYVSYQIEQIAVHRV